MNNPKIHYTDGSKGNWGLLNFCGRPSGQYNVPTGRFDDVTCKRCRNKLVTQAQAVAS